MKNMNSYKFDTRTRLTRELIARLLMKNREHKRILKNPGLDAHLVEIHTLMLNGNTANIKRLRATIAA